MNKICHADISYLFCCETNTKNYQNQNYKASLFLRVIYWVHSGNNGSHQSMIKTVPPSLPPISLTIHLLWLYVKVFTSLKGWKVKALFFMFQLQIQLSLETYCWFNSCNIWYSTWVSWRGCDKRHELKRQYISGLSCNRAADNVSHFQITNCHFGAQTRQKVESFTHNFILSHIYFCLCIIYKHLFPFHLDHIDASE